MPLCLTLGKFLHISLLVFKKSNPKKKKKVFNVVISFTPLASLEQNLRPRNPEEQSRLLTPSQSKLSLPPYFLWSPGPKGGVGGKQKEGERGLEKGGGPA